MSTSSRAWDDSDDIAGRLGSPSPAGGFAQKLRLPKKGESCPKIPVVGPLLTCSQRHLIQKNTLAVTIEDETKGSQRTARSASLDNLFIISYPSKNLRAFEEENSIESIEEVAIEFINWQ
jgi:hypothetical protein